MTVRTSEMQLGSIKEENGQRLDQIRPLRLDTIYRLAVSEASPLLTVEVGVTSICYQTSSSGSQSSTMHKQQLTEETHQAT